MPRETVYREAVRIWIMTWLAAGMFVAALVFIGFVFINPLAELTDRNAQSGAFFIPAAVSFSLGLFAVAFGKFNITATSERFSISAGMNANSVAWSEIESAVEDLSRRQSRNVLTAVPTILDGEPAMVYCIGRLPRIDITLKNERLRRIIFPTRQPDVLLKIIQEKTRKARGMPFTPEKDRLEMVSINAFGTPGTFDGIGGPPPFSLP